MTQTLPVTQVKQILPALLDKMKGKGNGFVITVHGKPSAVLMSLEEYREYESLKETEEILADKKLMASIRAGEADLAVGREYDWEDVKKEWALADAKQVQIKNRKGSKKGA